MNLISWSSGKKTYIAAAIGVALGVINGLHDAGVTTFVVPGYVMFGLGFLGLGTLRAGIAKSTEAAVFAGVSGAQTVLAALAAPAGTFTPLSPVPTAEQKVTQAAQTPGYAAASEQQKTEILNESQLNH